MLTHAQMMVEGRILSLPAKVPIAYANIGILNASIGTISEQDGSFSMRLTHEYAKDSILFSALGYEKVSIPVSSLVKGNLLTIYLKETAYRLSEIVVTAERSKPKIVHAGNAQFEGGSLYADTVNAGGAMALLIENKSKKEKVRYEYPSYIQGAQLMIVNNTFPDFKVRLRLMDVKMVGGKPEPGEDILEESVVVTSTMFDGWLKFDLTKYAIKVQGDFFLVFEWILEKKDRMNLYRQYEQFRKDHPDKVTQDYSYVNGQKIDFENFQGNFFFGTSFGISIDGSSLSEYTCYYRLNSFGLWYPSPSILAARVMLSNQSGFVPESPKAKEDSASVNELLSFYRVTPGFSNKELVEKDRHEINFFDNRMIDPVDIEVHQENNQLSFTAFNRSVFPYQLTMHFSHLFNLSPLVETERFTLAPGRSNLLKLSVVDPAIDHYHYELGITEEVGDPQVIVEADFPYLIPIGSGRIFQRPDSNGSAEDISANRFMMQEGDTVYAMRKGIISNTSNQQTSSDRILDASSLEILHLDGTVMAYMNLDQNLLFHKTNDLVIPGDALGLMNGDGPLEVQLFAIIPGIGVKQIPVMYSIGTSLSMPYFQIPEGKSVLWKQEVIRREWTEKEQRKYRQE